MANITGSVTQRMEATEALAALPEPGGGDGQGEGDTADTNANARATENSFAGATARRRFARRWALARREEEGDDVVGQIEGDNPYVVEDHKNDAGALIRFALLDIDAAYGLSPDAALVFARLDADEKNVAAAAFAAAADMLQGTAGKDYAALLQGQGAFFEDAALLKIAVYLASRYGGVGSPNFTFVGSPGTGKELAKRLVAYINHLASDEDIAAPPAPHDVSMLADVFSRAQRSDAHSLTAKDAKRLVDLATVIRDNGTLDEGETLASLQLLRNSVPSGIGFGSEEEFSGDIAQGAASIATTLTEALGVDNRVVKASNKFILRLVAQRLPEDPHKFAASLAELLPGYFDDKGQFKYSDFLAGGNTSAIGSLKAAFKVIFERVPGLVNGCDVLLTKTEDVVRNGSGDVCARAEALRFGRSLHGHLKRLGTEKYKGILDCHGKYEQKLQDEVVRAAELAFQAAMLALFNKTAAAFAGAGGLATGAPPRTVAQAKREYDGGGASGGSRPGDGGGTRQRGDDGASWQGDRGAGPQRNGGGGGYSRQRGGGDGGDARYRNVGGGGGGAGGGFLQRDGGGSRAAKICVNCFLQADHQANNCPNRREPMTAAPRNLNAHLFLLAERMRAGREPRNHGAGPWRQRLSAAGPSCGGAPLATRERSALRQPDAEHDKCRALAVRVGEVPAPDRNPSASVPAVGVQEEVWAPAEAWASAVRVGEIPARDRNPSARGGLGDGCADVDDIGDDERRRRLVIAAAADAKLAQQGQGQWLEAWLCFADGDAPFAIKWRRGLTGRDVARRGAILVPAELLVDRVEEELCDWAGLVDDTPRVHYGVITVCHTRHGEYDVQYDSGDASLRVPARRLCKELGEDHVLGVGSRIAVRRDGALVRWHMAVERAGRDEDAAVEAAIRGGGTGMERRRRGRVERHLTIDDMTPLAQEVIRAGFTFWIDAVGKPHVLVPRPVGLDLPHNRAILGEMQLLGWCDAELQSFMTWGVSDYSDKTPRGVSTFAPNHLSTVNDGMAVLYEKTLAKEVGLGWTLPGRYFPHVFPALVRPGGSRRKPATADEPDGSSRNLVDASWPKEGTPWAFARDSDGVLRLLASNANTDVGAIPPIEWSTVEVNAEAAAILGTACRRAGVGMRGGVIDLSKWFRQMVVASTEWTKQCLNWRGQYYLDVRMQMGKVSSANVAQRVTFLLVAACERRLDSEIAEFVAAQTGADWDGLRAWQADRLVAFGGDYVQARLYFMDSFQDDILCAVVHDDLATLVERRIPEIIRSLLVGVSDKTPPFSSRFVSIGAECDVTSESLRPRPALRAAYVEAAAWVEENRGRFVDYDRLEQFVGLREFSSRFADDRGCNNSAHRCLQPIAGMGGRCRIGSDFADDVQRIVNVLDDARGVHLVADPVYLYPPEYGAHGDASTTTGYEVVVSDGDEAHVFYGKWQRETLDAIAAVDVSISPLELTTGAYVADAVCR
ncbi:hypothetical protein M885DRAFT_573177 [Pelagophyceae sp. CCMP2097]|nr:hypothetical protein M885DRAFT_573177 [Pelagophyceae sp. CCMP2097]